jgi:hypothetical protein
MSLASREDTRISTYLQFLPERTLLSQSRTLTSFVRSLESAGNRTQVPGRHYHSSATPFTLSLRELRGRMMFPPVLILPLFLQSHRPKFNRFDFFIIFLFYRLMINILELVPYCQLHTIIMSFGMCSTIPFTFTYFSLTDDLQTCPHFLHGVQLLIFYSASVTDEIYLGIPFPSSSLSLWPWCSSFFQIKHITCLVIVQSNWYGLHR